MPKQNNQTMATPEQLAIMRLKEEQVKKADQWIAKRSRMQTEKKETIQETFETEKIAQEIDNL